MLHLPCSFLIGAKIFYITQASSSFQINFRSVRHLDSMEDSYYLRRKEAFYAHIFRESTGQAEVQSLFSSDFHSKILNAAAFTRSDSSNEYYLAWTKSPCDSLPPKLTNIWLKDSGFRAVLIENGTLRITLSRFIK